MADALFEIEKGVPLPPPSRAKYPFADMEIGDSFFIPGVRASTVIASSIAYRRTRYGERHRCAKEGDGLRIWRVA